MEKTTYRQSHSLTWSKFIILSIACTILIYALVYIYDEAFYPKGWIVIAAYITIGGIILLKGYRKKLELDEECLLYQGYIQSYLVYYNNIKFVEQETSSSHNDGVLSKTSYFLLKDREAKKILRLPCSIFNSENEKIQFLNILDHYPNIDLDYSCQVLIGQKDWRQDAIGLIEKVYTDYRKSKAKD
ncbi:hypothetical protein [Gracilibacillus saliphilus]|uniref:hypothetical protein n=1 Tax=Gracilibacillus saliphilus TaxID=543890 RepID=UPI0013D0452F|nr:hypothetical protein [Gracilibacillus saliphilus]